MNSYLPQLVSHIRGKLSPEGSLRRSFAGKCGLAQSISFFKLEDKGVEFKPFASQTLDGWNYGHASGTLIDQSGQLILVDPTFVQFAEDDSDGSPYQLLGQTQTGQELIEALESDGYCVLDDDKAYAYLESFLGGSELFVLPEDAFDMLVDPMPHRFNLVVGRNNVRATRENIAPFLS